MNELRASLDAELGELPPSGVDLRSLMSAERRRSRLRVAGGTTVVAGVAVAAVLAGTGVTGGDSRTAAGPAAGSPSGSPAAGPSACAPTAPPRPTTTPSPWIPTDAAPTAPPAGPDPDLPAGSEVRLSAGLGQAVQNELGAGRAYPIELDDVAHGPLRFFGGPCDPAALDFYLAGATIRSAAGDPLGRLLVYVQTSRDTGCTPLGGGGGCTVRRRPDGTVVRSLTRRGDLQGEVKAQALVTMEKPDGTVLQLISETGPGGRTPPLDVAALTRIGLDPGLVLYP